MATLPIKQIKGLVPLLDRKKIPEPFIFDATNTRVDINGPYSGFGWLQEAGANMGIITHHEDFEFGSEFFYGTDLGVCIYQKEAHRFEYIFSTGATFIDKWTFADVGGFLYICNPDLGIVQLNPLNGVFTTVDISLYGKVYAITAANNRLCILARLFVAWSAQDNGADLTPSIVTGAGNQSLSKLGSHSADTDYFDIVSVADGFLTFTTQGILKSTSLNSVNPFRHDVFSIDRRLFNKNCICKLNDFEWLFLSHTGLFKTDGKKTPEPWQPLLSEQLLDEIDLLPNKSSVGIFYNRTHRLIGVGLSTSGANQLFNKTYVVDLPSENIGILNELFYSRFIEVFTHLSTEVPEHGYITFNRDLVIFNEQPNMQNWIDYDGLFFRAEEEPALYTSTDGIINAITYVIGFEEALGIIGPLTNYYTPIYEEATLLSADPDFIATTGASDPWQAVAPAVLYDEAGSYFYNGDTSVLRVKDIFTAPFIANRVYEITIGIDKIINGAHVSVIIEPSLPAIFTLAGIHKAFVTPIGTWGDLQFTMAILTAPDDVRVTYLQAQLVQSEHPVGYATSIALAIGLNCAFTLGLFRFASEDIVDILGLVTNVELGTIEPFATLGDEVIDYLLDFGAIDVVEDWNLLDGEEDWGEGVATGASYRQTVFASLDGYAEWKPEFNELTEIAVEGKLKFCSARQEGLYFGVRILATDLDEFVHLKTLHANVTSAGRLL